MSVEQGIKTVAADVLRAEQTILGVDLPRVRDLALSELSRAALPETERLRAIVDSEGYAALDLL